MTDLNDTSTNQLPLNVSAEFLATQPGTANTPQLPDNSANPPPAHSDAPYNKLWGTDDTEEYYKKYGAELSAKKDSTPIYFPTDEEIKALSWRDCED